MGWINKLFNEYKFVRRYMIFWSTILVGWVVWMVFTNMEEVSTPVATVAVSVLGLVGTVLTFYQILRGKDK